MFFLASTLAAIMGLFIPGLLILSALTSNWFVSLTCAPPVSIAVLILTGIAMSFASIGGPLLLLAIATLVALVIYLASQKVRRDTSGHGFSIDAKTLFGIALYVITAGVFTYLIFIRNLPASTAFVQYDDNMTHLGAIKSMIDGGSLNIFASNAYSATAYAEVPAHPSGYYPAAYYLIAAIAGSIPGVITSTAENAANVALTITCFPLGMCALIDCLIDRKDKWNHWLAASVLTCAFLAFPLRMLTVHGAFPNFGAFCLVPSLCALFIRMLSLILEQSGSVIPSTLGFVLASIGTAATHPNAIFFASVILLPYLIMNFVPKLIRSKHEQSKKTDCFVRLTQLGLMALYILLWALLNRSNVMAGIVGFNWSWSMSVLEKIAALITCSYYFGVQQLPLAVLVAIGAVSGIRNRDNRWVVIAYLLCCAFFYFGAVDSELIKQLAIGFWYTDPERIAAMLSITAIPVAALGLSTLLSCIEKLLFRSVETSTKHRGSVATNVLVLFALGLLLYNTNSLLPSDSKASQWTTAIGQVEGVYNSESFQPYTKDEQAFVEEVKSHLPSNELVINFPYDGSIFSYPINNLNIYYKAKSLNNETAESQLIRTGLNRIAIDSEVQNAVREIGAKYVLVLDRGGFRQVNETDANDGYVNYRISQWTGLDITDETLGFELAMSEGNLRLYEITGM